MRAGCRWMRSSCCRIAAVSWRVTRLGSISAHAGDVVELGEGCADVVGQRVGAVSVWLADRPVSCIDCPCRDGKLAWSAGGAVQDRGAKRGPALFGT
jgi:hypothetical protein